MYAALLEECHDPGVLGPPVEPEQDKRLAEQFFYEPADDKTQYHHDDHHEDTEKYLLKIIKKVQEHVLEKLRNLLHANILCNVHSPVNGNRGLQIFFVDIILLFV